jgi:hypothetical protein
MTDDQLTANSLQTFAQGVVIELNGRKFMVEAIGDHERMRPHQLKGTRGASYWMHGYLSRENKGRPERYYITAVIGNGDALRGKNGRRIEAFIYGDLISSAN